jgi:hypothetical protein
VCVESKASGCTKKDPCKILAIGATFLSSRRYYSRVFRHRNTVLFCVAGTSFARSTAQISCAPLSSNPDFREQAPRLYRKYGGATCYGALNGRDICTIAESRLGKPLACKSLRLYKQHTHSVVPWRARILWNF